MRVAMYYSNSDIRIEEMPRPQVGRGELLVRVEASGICGSDVMEWYRRGRTPLVLGHEVGGVIEEVDSGVNTYKKGDRVSLAHHVPCDHCHYCLSGHSTVCETLRKTNFSPGGFVEFLRLSPIHAEKGIFLLPQNVSFDEATFVEPLACVLRGQRQAGGVKDKFVLVIGSGIAGILHIHLAKFNAAGYIAATDITEYRLECAKKFGADTCINAKELSADKIRSLNEGRLADLVIVTAGHPQAIMQALESVERAGAILFFAPAQDEARIPFPFNELFWRAEITITSSYAASPKDYQEALDLIAAKKLKIQEMITHRLPLAETGLGFKLVAEAKESLKVIVYPNK